MREIVLVVSLVLWRRPDDPGHPGAVAGPHTEADVDFVVVVERIEVDHLGQ